MKDCIIIGAGPAGIGAALELKKVDIDFLLVEKADIGGKVNIAPSITNYPGYKEIEGPELVKVYADKIFNKVNYVADEVIRISKVENYFIVKLDHLGEIKTKTVIVATGSTNRIFSTLEETSEELGWKTYYNVLKYNHSKKDITAIFGGGNAALKEAIYLADRIKKVYLIHRRDEFRGNQKLVEELKSRKNVEILTPYVAKHIELDYKNAAPYFPFNHKIIELRNTKTDAVKKIYVNHYYSSIGQVPNSELCKTFRILNDSKEIIYDRKDNSTAIKGLFAAGDVTTTPVKQIYASEFSGKKAAESVVKYLKESI